MPFTRFFYSQATLRVLASIIIILFRVSTGVSYLNTSLCDTSLSLQLFAMSGEGRAEFTVCFLIPILVRFGFLAEFLGLGLRSELSPP
jgi:hypothetical protein